MEVIKPGERTGVFEAIDATGEIRFFGYGTYRGQLPIPGWEQHARELLPLYRASWQQVLNSPIEPLIEQTRSQLGDGTSDADAQAVVRTRLEQLQARTQWSDDEAIEWLRDNDQMLRNPYIELDDGRSVWGFEVWWTSEAEARAQIDALMQQGYTLVQV